MKFIYAIVHAEDGEGIIEALIKADYPITRMASTGGFFRYGNITLLIPAKEKQIEQVFDLLKTQSSHTPPNQYAITAFVVNMSIYQTP